MQAEQRKALAALIAQHTHDGVNDTALPGVTLFRASQADAPLPSVYNPCLCFIAQGDKQVMLGEAIYRYRAGEYLAVSVDLPLMNQIITATPQAPYLLLKIDIDPSLLSGLLPVLPAIHSRAAPGLFTGQADARLSDALLRMARLLNAPDEIPVLASQTLREVLYRVLMAPALRSWR